MQFRPPGSYACRMPTGPCPAAVPLFKRKRQRKRTAASRPQLRSSRPAMYHATYSARPRILTAIFLRRSSTIFSTTELWPETRITRKSLTTSLMKASVQIKTSSAWWKVRTTYLEIKLRCKAGPKTVNALLTVLLSRTLWQVANSLKSENHENDVPIERILETPQCLLQRSATTKTFFFKQSKLMYWYAERVFSPIWTSGSLFSTAR